MQAIRPRQELRRSSALVLRSAMLRFGVGHELGLRSMLFRRGNEEPKIVSVALDRSLVCLCFSERLSQLRTE